MSEAYDVVHAERFRLSLDWLRPLLAPGDAVLECGAPGAFTAMLRAALGVEVQNSTWDLRYPAPDGFARGSFAAVLCMEVLEHLHDQDRPLPTEWVGTGAAAMLASAFALLRPGGFLFLTTPNACSLNTLHKLLHQAPPFVYRPHVREYGPHEVTQLLHTAGFRCEKFAALDPWHSSMGAAERKSLLQVVQSLRLRTDILGEDLFVIARKP